MANGGGNVRRASVSPFGFLLGASGGRGLGHTLVDDGENMRSYDQGEYPFPSRQGSSEPNQQVSFCVHLYWGHIFTIHANSSQQYTT